MKRHCIDGSNSRHDCGCGLTGVRATKPSGNINASTYPHSNPLCKCCGTDANAIASTHVFLVMGMNAAFLDPIWVVAVHENKQDAYDHMKAAQAVADKLYEEYQSGLIEEDDVGCLGNEYDPYFSFQHDAVRYEVDDHELLRAGRGLEAVKKWAAG